MIQQATSTRWTLPSGPNFRQSAGITLDVRSSRRKSSSPVVSRPLLPTSSPRNRLLEERKLELEEELAERGEAAAEVVVVVEEEEEVKGEV